MKRQNILGIVLLLLFVMAGTQVFGADRYWVSATASNWNNTANWSTTSGGAGGASVPGSGDVAIFNGATITSTTLTAVGSCSVDATVNVQKLQTVSGYTGTISQNANTITVGSGGMILAGGTFTGSSSAITIIGDYNNSGCTFTSTSGTLDLQQGDFSLTGGSFTHNNGNVKFSYAVTSGTVDTCNINITVTYTANPFYKLNLNSASNTQRFIFAGSSQKLLVANELTADGSGTKTIYTGTVEAQGDVTISGGSFNSTSGGLLLFGGGSNQTLSQTFTAYGDYLPEAEINKTGGTLTIGSNICTKRGLKRTGTSGTINFGTTKFFVNNSGAVTYSGNFTGSSAFYKLEFVGYSYPYYLTIDNRLEVTDSLINSRVTYFSKGTGEGILEAKGHIRMSGVIDGSATLLVSGGNAQHYKSNGNAFPKIKVAKTSGTTLYFDDNHSMSDSFIYVSGTINQNGYRLTISANAQSTFVGTFSLQKVRVSYSFSPGYYVRFEPSAVLTITDTLWISGNYYGTMLLGTVNVEGNIVVDNTSTGTNGGGTTILKINGTGNQTITGVTSTQNTLLPNITINKPSGMLTLKNTVNCGGDWIYIRGASDSLYADTTSTVTFSNVKTITGSHTLYRMKYLGGLPTTSTISSGTTITVTKLLSITGSQNTILNTGTIRVLGDIYISNTNTSGGGGSATILINGTGTQNFTDNGTVGSGNLCRVTINKTSGTLNLDGTISVKNNWTYTAGSVNTGSSTVAICASATISGTQNFNSLTFSPGTTASSFNINGTDTLKVNGTLRLEGTGRIWLNTNSAGIIRARGNIEAVNTSTVVPSGTNNNVKILIDGSADQSFTGSGASGSGVSPRVEIDKTGGTLSLNSFISMYGHWVYTKGNVSPGSSSVIFYGAFNLDGQGTGFGTPTMPFNHVTFGSGNRTLTGDLIAKGDLSIATTTTLTASTYNVNVGRNWTQTSTTGTFSVTTGTVTFDGGSDGSITRNSGGSTVSFPRMTINKAAGNLSLASPLNVTTTLTLTKGRLLTTSTNIIELSDNATCTGGSDSAYVSGPFRKTGNDVFTFPLGSTTLSTGAYHPLSITAPSATTDKFDATYFAIGQTVGSTMVDSLENISTCEYFELNRVAGSSNVTAKLGWNSNNCNVHNPNDVVVSAWDGTKWRDMGASTVTTSGVTGTVTSNGAISLSYPIKMTFGMKKNKVNYCKLYKKPDGGFYTVRNGKLPFVFEDEYANTQHYLNVKIWNSSHVDVYPTLTTYASGTGLPSKIGDMRFVINLYTQSSMTLLPYGSYFMEVTNEKNEKQYLKFVIPDPLIE